MNVKMSFMIAVFIQLENDIGKLICRLTTKVENDIDMKCHSDL